MATIFISYRWGDKASRDSLEATLNNPNNSFYDIPLEDRERYNTTAEIQSYIDRKLNDASCIIALIGERGPDGRWMNHELKSAKRLSKPIIPVRIKDTLGITPNVISDLEIVEWNVTEIQNAINNVFGR